MLAMIRLTRPLTKTNDKATKISLFSHDVFTNSVQNRLMACQAWCFYK